MINPEITPNLLGINDDQIDKTNRNISTLIGEDEIITEADQASLVNGILLRMFHEQRELLKYIHHESPMTEDFANVFLLGAVITYDLLPEDIRIQDLGDLSQFKKEVREGMKIEDGRQVWSPDGYISRLEKKSPDFLKWLSAQTGQYEKDYKNAFMTGALIVSMPFFRAEEAKMLESALYGEDSLE